MLRIYVLGQFRVEVNGVELTADQWPRRDVKRLLQLLAVRSSHRLSKEQISESLWPGVAQLTARNRLYNILYVLRGVLEPQRPQRAASSFVHSKGEVIELGPPDRIWIDADAFEQSLDAAVVQSDANLAQRVALLEQAIALYHGPLLPVQAVGYEEDWIGSDRAHLQERYRNALRTQAQAEQQLGHSDAAIRALQRLVATDRTDEPAQRSLIDALAQAGRRAEALAQYRLCKEVLASELGVAPDAQTMALYQGLKAQIGILVAGAPAQSPATDAVPVTAITTAADESAAVKQIGEPCATPVRMHHLPHALSGLIGRDQELTTLRALYAEDHQRLLTLTGVGGVGKTRLGLRLAAELQNSFEHGAALVSLAALEEPQLVASTVAQALGLTQSGAATPRELLLSYLADKQLLLFLDNFEHLLGAAPLIGELLAQAPQLTVLTTSRTALHLQGEQVFTVAPLALPGPADLDSPKALARVPAVALFMQRASAIDASFQLNRDNAATVAALCTRLDGLPLALELAAARIRLFAPADLLERLERRFVLLGQGPCDNPHRHRSLAAVLDWSYQLLSPAAQQLFARLSVFAGGRTLVAIQAVCATDSSAPEELVDTLLDQHLLVPQPGQHHPRRFWMLETVHAYAAERLDEMGEQQSIAQRHAAYFTAHAEIIEPELRGPKQKERLDLFEVEHDNLRAALRWAIAHDAEMAYRLAAALSRFWYLRGHFYLARDYIDELLRLPRPSLSRSASKLISAAARLAWRQGDLVRSERLVSESIEIMRCLGDTAGVFRSLVGLGAIALQRGEYQKAAKYFSESLNFAKKVGDKRMLASASNNLGLALCDLGQFRDANRLFTNAFEHYESNGDELGSGYALIGLGTLAQLRGLYAIARDRFELTLSIARRFDNSPMLAEIMSCLGECAAECRQYGEATDWLTKSLELSKRLGDRWLESLTLARLGGVAIRQNDHTLAKSNLDESVKGYKEIGNVRDSDCALRFLLLLSIRKCDLASARTYMSTLVSLEPRLPLPRQFLLLEAAAKLACAERDTGFALLLLSISARQRRDAGLLRSPDAQIEFDEIVGEIQKQLGEPRWRAAWEHAQATAFNAANLELKKRFSREQTSPQYMTAI